MTDPVTNAEIEDVLSSIRRLVSSEHTGLRSASRPAERTAPDPRGAGDKPDILSDGDTPEPESDRLVLTPALRVSVDNVPPQDDGRSAADQVAEPGPGFADVAPDEAANALGLRYDSGLEQRIAELEAAIAHTEGPDPDRDVHPSFHGAPETAILDEAAAATDPAPAEAEAEAPESPFLADMISAKAADYKASLWPEDSSDAPEPPQDHWPADDGAPHVEEVVTAGLAGTPDIAAPAPDEDEARESDRQSMRAELPADDLAGWDTDDDRHAGAEQRVEDTATGDTAADDGPLLLDEEVLRDLVSQMVRDELQGVLGEKITRNLRRLVRREIQRALAARDAE